MKEFIREFMRKYIIHPLLFSFLMIQPLWAQDFIEKESRNLRETVIGHRRHLHQNPELSNREFKTAQYIAKHLREWNLEVKENVAHTGVVGILRTTRPGPVVALRADMDALPVEEKSGLNFASKTKSMYNGQEVSVSHACGHDAHVAILLGTAQLLSKHRSQLKGTIVFIFQPAEEGPPEGEEGGALMMIKEGVLDTPKVDVIFGLHLNAHAPSGHLWYKPGAFMASADWFKVEVTGKQAHGAKPWNGVDPIMVATQIIQGFQTIVARQTDLTKSPLVLTVGKINGGIRENIIPEKVSFGGSIRVMDTSIQYQTHRTMELIANNIAEAYGATAKLTIDQRCPVTYNTPTLVQKMIPALEKAAGKDWVKLTEGSTWSEDFAWYGTKVPAFFFNLGGMSEGLDPEKVAPHHTPEFFIEDQHLDVGVRAFCYMVMAN